MELTRLADCEQLPNTQTYFGRLQAKRELLVTSKLAERVANLYFDIGDEVQEGQVLAQLESSELESILALAQAELSAAEAHLLELRAGPRPQEIEIARAVLRERQADLEFRQATQQRHLTAAMSNSVTPNELDNSKFMLQSSRAECVQAQQALEQLLIGARQEQIDAQEAVVEAMARKRELASIRLADTLIRAPFSGRIQERMVDEGQLLASGQVIARLIESDCMEVHVGLPPAVGYALSSRTDATGQVMVAVGEQSLSAELDRIAPALDEITGLRKAIFAVSDSQAKQFASGTAVEVRVPVHSGPSGWWVPSECLTSAVQGQWAVLKAQALDGQTAYSLELVAVDYIRHQQERVLIRGALQADDLIIVSGLHRVSPGQLVRRSTL